MAPRKSPLLLIPIQIIRTFASPTVRFAVSTAALGQAMRTSMIHQRLLGEYIQRIVLVPRLYCSKAAIIRTLHLIIMRA